MLKENLDPPLDHTVRAGQLADQQFLDTLGRAACRMVETGTEEQIETAKALFALCKRSTAPVLNPEIERRFRAALRGRSTNVLLSPFEDEARGFPASQRLLMDPTLLFAGAQLHANCGEGMGRPVKSAFALALFGVAEYLTRLGLTKGDRMRFFVDAAERHRGDWFEEADQTASVIVEMAAAA